MTGEEKIDAYSIPEPNSGCTLWLGALNAYGYGVVRTNGKARLAHRVSWEVANGPIPDGMCVCHKCDVPACVNPEHLFLGTHQTNMADMASKGRQPRGIEAYGAKLSDDDIRVIRADMRSGQVIAAEYGIDASLVYRIRSRSRRIHVSDLPTTPSLRSAA